MDASQDPGLAVRVWPVGALCRAVADALEARFNPVAVRGEVTGFSRAASGHCYFSLKDETGQLRCAMFRRAAGLLDALPRDGDSVEVRGRLAVYEPRGDLQLIVESLVRAGQGSLFEQFLRLKERLQAEGLFDAGRKRALPALPRAIGLVTSTGAAALHDVVTCLRRRAPHVPVVLAPASVQGAQAPVELVAALQALYKLAKRGELDAIVLVRGGGSLEDLWAFNDERLARTIVDSPVPLVCGVGHETDFTIADFCADVRAPTPTAAAEMVALPRQDWLGELAIAAQALQAAAWRRMDLAGQRLDQMGARLGRPSARLAQQHMRLSLCGQRLRLGCAGRMQQERQRLELAAMGRVDGLQQRLGVMRECLDRLALRLQLMDPRRVLQRGYALLTDEQGRAVTSVQQVHIDQPIRAALADGEVDLRVVSRRANGP